MTQLQWAKRDLERIGTPVDLARTGWQHAPPTAECIERGYAAAVHAFELGLPIESLGASARTSSEAKPTGGYVWGDLPADVTLMLGQHWTKKHTSLWIWFKADGRAKARAWAANYPKKHAWNAPFTEALWPRIAAWLRQDA